MTEQEKDLREALAAGPSGGAWFVGAAGPNGCPTIGAEGGLMVAMLAHSINEPDQRDIARANAAFIAQANPVAISALLDELSRLRQLAGASEEKNETSMAPTPEQSLTPLNVERLF